VARRFAKTFGLLLLAIAAWQLAPAQTQASCGDYVVMGRHAGISGGQHIARKPQSSPPGTPKLPCHGPSCGKGPVLPLTSPTVVVFESETHRPLLSLAGDCWFDECWAFAVWPQRALSVLGPMKEIEHPPQLV
jgi:hypothetical protein